MTIDLITQVPPARAQANAGHDVARSDDTRDGKNPASFQDVLASTKPADADTKSSAHTGAEAKPDCPHEAQKNSDKSTDNAEGSDTREAPADTIEDLFIDFPELAELKSVISKELKTLSGDERAELKDKLKSALTALKQGIEEFQSQEGAEVDTQVEAEDVIAIIANIINVITDEFEVDLSQAFAAIGLDVTSKDNKRDLGGLVIDNNISVGKTKKDMPILHEDKAKTIVDVVREVVSVRGQSGISVKAPEVAVAQVSEVSTQAIQSTPRILMDTRPRAWDAQSSKATDVKASVVDAVRSLASDLPKAKLISAPSAAATGNNILGHNPSSTMEHAFSLLKGTPIEGMGSHDFTSLMHTASQARADIMPGATPAHAQAQRFNALIGKQIKNAEISNGKTTIELAPRGLGDLEITIETDRSGAVRAVIRAENPNVLDYIKQERQQLSDLLANAGFDMENSELDFGSFTQSDNQSGSRQNGDLLDEGEVSALSEDDTSNMDATHTITSNSIDIAI